MQPIQLDALDAVCGGANDQPAVPSNAELAEELRFQEHERYRAFEKKHKVFALYCQGDRSCLYKFGAR